MHRNLFVLVFFFACLFSFSLVTPVEATHEYGMIHENTKAACEAAGGTCKIGGTSCNLGGGTPEDMLGNCEPVNGMPYSCCKIKEQMVGPGTDYYCTTTLLGNCKLLAEGCAPAGQQVGTCTTVQSTTRVCCKALGPPGVNGPQLSPYQLLEQIPGSSATTGDLKTYLEDIYKFAFWTIGIAVVFMLSIGGFMYLTSAGNNSRMESAKGVIWDALLGLVLALVAWLFLYIINPDLVEIELPTSVRTFSPGNTIAPPPIVGGDNQTLAAQILANGNISLSSSGSCTSASGTVSPRLSITQAAAPQAVIRCQNGCPGTGACTATTGLSDSMLRAMLQVAAQYPYTVTSITGGSHTPTSHHYAGRAIDITTGNKSQWPTILSAFRAAGSNGSQTSCDLNGKFLPDSQCSSANHMHIAF